jgi:hypothetical protein
MSTHNTHIILTMQPILAGLASAMRDDIHKSAPVNAAWRRFLGRCTREADWGDRAREAADNAIKKDCRREILPALVHTLGEKCSDPSGDFFGSRFDGLTAGLASHVLARELVDRLRCMERSGRLSGSALEHALTDVMDERMQSVARAMSGYLLKEPGRRPAECVRAMTEAMRGLSAADYAREMIANSGRLAHPVRTSPSLEEVLPIVK